MVRTESERFTAKQWRNSWGGRVPPDAFHWDIFAKLLEKRGKEERENGEEKIENYKREVEKLKMEGEKVLK